ncbi:MAG: GatB/YqeY domain-containing protein [Chlorobi bacterium]|nr:GatB/YqeY domain-containing protein [Chlorobiota bacterium]
MSLETIINDEMKKAMIAGEKERLLVIRSIRAEIIKFAKSGSNEEMTEEKEKAILMTAAKKRRDAIKMYEDNNRQEAADKEKEELEIIKEFLPAQLSDEEVKAAVKALADKIGAKDAKDFGKLMGMAMKEMKGKTDGSKVQQFVKEILN